MASLVDDSTSIGASSGLEYGSHVTTIVLQHTDLMLRWCALTLCLRESSSGLMHLLLLLSKIFEKIRSSSSQLHEGEMVTLIPALIEKCGHKSERHKAAFKSLLLAARYIVPVNRFCQLLLQVWPLSPRGGSPTLSFSCQQLQGLRCKNKKTRVVCIEIIDLIIAGRPPTPSPTPTLSMPTTTESGPSVLGKQGIKEIGSIFNTKDTDVGVRNAALDFCFTLYVCVGRFPSALPSLLPFPTPTFGAVINQSS
jgi:hypothetical protein